MKFPGYTVWIKETGQNWTKISGNLTSTEFIHLNPPTGTVQYTVKAHKASGASGIVAVSFTIPAPQPLVALPPFGAPTMTGTVLENGSVSLSWNAVADATFYTVWVKENGQSWRKISGNLISTEFLDQLPPTGTVQYTVKAHNASGASGFIAITVTVPNQQQSMLDVALGVYDPLDEVVDGLLAV